MTASIDRQLIAQLVIVYGVCFGAWMLLVDPKATALRKVQAELEASQQRPVLLEQESIEVMAGRMGDVRERLIEIDRLNRMAEDSSELYTAIMDLADENGVTVQLVQPGRVHPATEDSSVSASQFNVTVEGLYGSVAEFLDAVGDLDGFIRPRHLSLTPIDMREEDTILARFTCEALHFELPGPLAHMVKGADDES